MEINGNGRAKAKTVPDLSRDALRRNGYTVDPIANLSHAGLVRLWLAVVLVRAGIKLAPLKVRAEAPRDYSDEVES